MRRARDGGGWGGGGAGRIAAGEAEEEGEGGDRVGGGGNKIQTYFEDKKICTRITNLKPPNLSGKACTRTFECNGTVCVCDKSCTPGKSLPSSVSVRARAHRGPNSGRSALD